MRGEGYAIQDTHDLCLAKIKSAFEINDIQRGRVICYMDDIQLFWSFDEGQRSPLIPITQLGD